MKTGLTIITGEGQTTVPDQVWDNGLSARVTSSAIWDGRVGVEFPTKEGLADPYDLTRAAIRQ